MSSTHPIHALLRQLRKATGMSLEQFEQKHYLRAVVLGSWERGDREATVEKIDSLLHIHGYQFAVVPLGSPFFQGDAGTGERVWTPGQIGSVLRSIAGQVDPAAAVSVPEQDRGAGR